MKASPSRQIAYIGLGANLGRRRRALGEALERLADSGQVTVDAVSPVYETSPLGTPGPPFCNAAARIGTELSPPQLLKLLLSVERAMGRRRKGAAVGPRPIDLDLLLAGDAVISSPELILPHPRMAGRLFVLRPLADLDPALTPPGWRLTVAQAAHKVAMEQPGQRVKMVGDLNPGTRR